MASLYQLDNREVPWMDPKAAFSANGTAPFCQPMPWRYLEPRTQRILESAKPKKTQRRLETYGTSHFDITIMIVICLSSQNPKLKFTTSIIWTFASSFSCPRSNFWWSRGQLQRWLYSAFATRPGDFFASRITCTCATLYRTESQKKWWKKTEANVFSAKDLTLPKANMVHLKMAPWNRSFFLETIILGSMLNLGSIHQLCHWG